MPKRYPHWVRWLPLVAGTLWGTAFPTIQIALSTFSPFDIAFGRGAIGALSLGLWLLVQGNLVWHLPRETWLRLFVLALLGSGFFWPVQTMAVKFSTPVNVAFLISTQPVVIAILAVLILKERLHSRTVVSLLLALVGTYLIISKGRLLELFASETLPGDLLALLASCLFSTYIVLGRRWRDATLNVSSRTLTVYTFGLATPVLATFALADGPLPAAPTLATAGAIVWLGIMVTTAAFLAINTGMSVGVVSRSSIPLFIIPLVASVLTWLLFGTTLTLPQWIGGGFVLTGIAIANR